MLVALSANHSNKLLERGKINKMILCGSQSCVVCKTQDDAHQLHVVYNGSRGCEQ